MCGAEPVSINIVYEQLRAGRGGGELPQAGLADGANKTRSRSPQHPGLALPSVSHAHSVPNRAAASHRALKHASPGRRVSTRAWEPSWGAHTRRCSCPGSAPHTATAPSPRGTQAAAPGQGPATPGAARPAARAERRAESAGLLSAPPRPEPLPSPPSTLAVPPEGQPTGRGELEASFGTCHLLRGTGPSTRCWRNTAPQPPGLAAGTREGCAGPGVRTQEGPAGCHPGWVGTPPLRRLDAGSLPAGKSCCKNFCVPGPWGAPFPFSQSEPGSR